MTRPGIDEAKAAAAAAAASTGAEPTDQANHRPRVVQHQHLKIDLHQAKLPVENKKLRVRQKENKTRRTNPPVIRGREED